MPLFHVHLTAEPPTTYPPLAEMLAVPAASPQAAVESLLASGRIQTPGLKWACVVTEAHDNGMPKRVLRFAISQEPVTRIEWDEPV
jgi:hypothetical protein